MHREALEQIRKPRIPLVPVVPTTNSMELKSEMTLRKQSSKLAIGGQ